MDINNFTKPFTKKSFKDRMKDTGFLIKNSFTIMGKDEDIKTPLIKMIIFTTIIRILFFISLIPIFTAHTHENIGLIVFSILTMIFLVLVIIPFRFFFDIRQKANQSWIVYNTLCGKDISYQDSVDHTKSEKGKLRIIGVVDLLITYGKAGRNENNFLMNLLFGFLEEVWDLLSHFMLPSIVIEQKKLKEIVPDLKSLKENVPATLTGVFGLDFAGNVITGIVIGVFAILFLVSIGIGWLIALVSDVGVIHLFGDANFTISWIPGFIIIMIGTIASGIMKKIVESIKAIYFTIFYTSIKQPENIADDMKEELTHYLLLKETK